MSEVGHRRRQSRQKMNSRTDQVIDRAHRDTRAFIAFVRVVSKWRRCRKHLRPGFCLATAQVCRYPGRGEALGAWQRVHNRRSMTTLSQFSDRRRQAGLTHKRETSSATISAAGRDCLASATLCPAHMESASISPVVPTIGGAGS